MSRHFLVDDTTGRTEYPEGALAHLDGLDVRTRGHLWEHSTILGVHRCL